MGIRSSPSVEISTLSLLLSTLFHHVFMKAHRPEVLFSRSQALLPISRARHEVLVCAQDCMCIW